MDDAASPITLNINGKEVSDPIKVSDLFNEYFSSIADNFDVSLPNNPSDTQSQVVTNKKKFLILSMAMHNILHLVTMLPQNKATGLDGISSNYIKFSIHSIISVLLCTCNMGIKHGIFPYIWKKTRQIPIYKAEIQTERGNYRPICILSILSKLLK